MAQLTLQNLVDFVQTFIPGKSTASIMQAAIAMQEELFLEVSPRGYTSFTCTAPFETGTVTATEGDATVTHSASGWTAAMAGQLIDIEGSDARFFIATRTDADDLELESAFDGDSGAGLTFTVMYGVITLPEDVGSIIEISRQGHGSLMRRDSVLGSSDSELLTNPGVPVAFIEIDPDSSGNMRIRLDPPPDDDYVYNVRFHKRPVAFTDVPDASGLAPEYNTALKYGTLELCWDQEDAQARSATWRSKKFIALQRARGLALRGAEGRWQEPGSESETELTNDFPVV